MLVAGFAGTASAQMTGGKVGLAMFEGLTNRSEAVQPSQAEIQQVSCDCGVPDCGEYGACCGDAGMCDLGCGDGGCGIGGMAGRGQVFFGAEYLSLRANFSEATAYREQDITNDLETLHQFNFDYGDSYRLYGGYRLADCGCEIRFAYSNFDSSGSFNSGPNPNAQTDGRVFIGPYEVDLGDGDTLIGEASVSVDNYDIGMSKTIPLGCLSACGGCGDCCDPCGCGPVCPAWDITWSGGIRIANVDSVLGYRNVRDPANTTATRSAASTVNFDGVGLRFGLGGRRYFGRSGTVSAYVKGDISLLLGDVDYGVSGDPQLLDITMSSTQLVPVTEIEAGLTGYLTQNVSISGGYLLSAWHDLGHRAEYDFSATGTQFNSMDDANLMTFDGFFLRAEAAF